MIKRLFPNKPAIRCLIFSVIVCTAYIFSIFYLFGIYNILWSITCIFVIFIFFHFLFIDIKNIKIKYRILTMLSVTLFELWCFILAGWDTNIWIILSLISYNATLIVLGLSLGMVDFNTISYFTRWWFIFTVWITITYSFALVGMFQEFPLTCQWLNDASNKLYQTIQHPLSVFKKQDKIDLDSHVEQKIWDIINEINNTEIVWSQNILTEKFNQLKSNIIDELISDVSEYNDSVCDILLNNINQKFKSNWIKWSVIIMSYLLLYGFIRIAFFIMSWIAFIIFEILYLVKVYKIKTTTKDVSEIY